MTRQLRGAATAAECRGLTVELEGLATRPCKKLECVFAAPGSLRDAQRRRPRSSQRECSRRRHADRAGYGWRGVDIVGRAMVKVMRSA